MNASPQWLRLLRLALWIAYGINWIGGVGDHLVFGGIPDNMTWAAPVFLLLSSLLVIVSAPEDWKALLIIFVTGFTAEAIGVATGYPFSTYTYSHVLSPDLLRVPIVMAGAWMILADWVRQLRLPAWAGALVMVCIDLLIDPSASNTLGFWHWQTKGTYYGVPLMNFLGWFVVSWLIFSLVRTAASRNPAVFAIGASILVFFMAISLAHGLLVPFFVGLMLCGAGYWRWSSSRVFTRI